MAGRQRATFQKRQREVKRLEKQRLKAEIRAARRLEQAQNRALAASRTREALPEELAASEIQPPLPEPR